MWTDKLDFDDCIEYLRIDARGAQPNLTTAVVDRLVACVRERFNEPVRPEQAPVAGETRPVYRWPDKSEILAHLGISHGRTDVDFNSAMGYHTSIHVADVGGVNHLDHVHLNTPDNRGS